MQSPSQHPSVEMPKQPLCQAAVFFLKPKLLEYPKSQPKQDTGWRQHLAYKEQMYVWRLTITDYKKHSSFSSEDVLLWELMELPKLYGIISLSKIVFSRGIGGGISGWQWSPGPQRWRWCPEDPGILDVSWQVLDGHIGSLGARKEDDMASGVHSGI